MFKPLGLIEMIEKGHSIKLVEREFRRLNMAKRIYERDTQKKLSFGEFIDRLVLAYVFFREKRGYSESTYLEKLFQEEGAKPE